ncbi:hypothetical protein KM043_012350 [Ampulex compressa]|nr:hypothetical protein KM043_012350 [Ampulex compressa]
MGPAGARGGSRGLEGARLPELRQSSRAQLLPPRVEARQEDAKTFGWCEAARPRELSRDEKCLGSPRSDRGQGFLGGGAGDFPTPGREESRGRVLWAKSRDADAGLTGSNRLRREREGKEPRGAYLAAAGERRSLSSVAISRPRDGSFPEDRERPPPGRAAEPRKEFFAKPQNRPSV